MVHISHKLQCVIHITSAERRQTGAYFTDLTKTRSAYSISQFNVNYLDPRNSQEDDRELRNAEFHNLRPYLNIIAMNRWAGNLACMGEMRNTCRV